MDDPSTAMKIPADLEPALDELPLFPLHQAVLFPGALLPLHVFEPRYRQLVHDVLDSHRTLSIAHIVDAVADPRGHVPIAPVAGIGTIVEHQELPGGRSNIVVLGRARVRLQELHFAPPYRRAMATLLQTEDDNVPGIELASLHAAAGAFMNLVRERDADFELHIPKDASAGMVADAFAAHLVISARERQSALETLGARERVVRLTEVLTVQRATLSSHSSADLN
jgi:Lon protease-like protein